MQPNSSHHSPPVVLIIAGNDPSGGAGIAADLATCAALGCHGAPVITCLTVQDTRNVYAVEPVTSDLLIQQIQAACNDLPVAAIKFGVLASQAQIAAVTTWLANDSSMANIPIVVDPVLVATGGGELTDQTDNSVATLRRLLAFAAVVTPNHRELAVLVNHNAASNGSFDVSDSKTRHAIDQLLTTGVDNILLTGGDQPNNTAPDAQDHAHQASNVCNAWCSQHGEFQTYTWPYIIGADTTTAGLFHGSGCTLASAIACQLALGIPMAAALQQAQQFVHNSLVTAYRVGQGQNIPNRLQTIQSQT